MLVVDRVLDKLLLVLVVLVVVEIQVILEQQILVAVQVVALVGGLLAQAVQALSFFATPAQFNISLVAQ
jgi:hypothetical protein